MKSGKNAEWRRKTRVRKRVRGDADRPRLSVFRSQMHIYSQLIDDSKGVTIVAVSTLSPLFRERFSKEKDRKKSAKAVGQLMAELAKKTGIERVVFDRGSYRYHGRVRALAEGAREGGLKF